MNVSAFISGNINLSVSYNVNLHVWNGQYFFIHVRTDICWSQVTMDLHLWVQVTAEAASGVAVSEDRCGEDSVLHSVCTCSWFVNSSI